MKHSHTKGPWKAEYQRSKKGNAEHFAIRQVGGCVVARTPSCGRDDEELHDILKADAAIMAAAPELLDALEGFHNCYKDFDSIRPEIREKIAKAIAKAKGE